MSHAPIQAELFRLVGQVRDGYHRLVLLVGEQRSGKTHTFARTAEANGWPLVNLNLCLAERLLDLTVKQRAVRVPAVVEEITCEFSADVVLVDNIEILFSEELSLDPLRLFQNLSRNRSVVVAWPGSYNSDVLTYAEPSHREYRKYSKPQVAIVRTSPDIAHTTTAGGTE